jgi:hypothetical protein
MSLRDRVHDGTELTNAAQTLLTFGLNLTEGGAKLWGFTVANRDTVEHRVTVQFVPFGASPTESNCIFEEIVLARSTIGVSGPWFGNSQYYVSAVSDDADSDVSVRVTASEEEQSS